MADFYPLLSGAVANLPQNTAAARQALYERVRGMLQHQLQSANPTIGTAELDRERRGLEEAIDRIEAEAGRQIPAAAKAPTVLKVAPPARAGGAKRMAIGIVTAAIVAGVLAGGYFMYSHFGSPTSGTAIAAVPAGSDAMTINGRFADYGSAASRPSDVLLLHVRCGATIVERDARSNPANPAGHVDNQGRFSITAQKASLGEIIKVGVRARTGPADELHQDFLVLGFFTGEQLELLTGADGKTIKISPQGEILNAGDAHISSAVPPILIVTRRADGNIYASGGAFAFSTLTKRDIP